MRIKKRIRRTTKQYIIVSLICIIVIGGAALITGLLVIGQIRDEYHYRLNQANKELQANQRDVYVAITDIFVGDTITENKLELVRVYSSQPMELYISKKDIGRIAIVDIPCQTQVLTTMLSGENVASEIREVEYNVINFNVNITEKDTVDIRICYPNGESYVVLAKKMVKGYIPEAAICHLWLNEEELLRMSAAIVDAGLYKGSYLYVTKYIEPNIQEPSIVNYTPSLAILTLLETDPNILVRATQELNRAVRKQLENRLAMSMGVDVSKINWDINPNVNVDFNSIWEGQSDRSLEEVPPRQEAGEVGDELGMLAPSDKFSYFIEEVRAKERDIEYGE